MPCFPAVLLSIFAVCGIEWPSAVQARKFANCNFKIIENTTGTQRLKAIFSAKLPPYQNLSHSCVVKANESNHFLRVKAKRNKQPKGKKKIAFTQIEISLYCAKTKVHDILRPIWCILNRYCRLR